MNAIVRMGTNVSTCYAAFTSRGKLDTERIERRSPAMTAHLWLCFGA